VGKAVIRIGQGSMKGRLTVRREVNTTGCITDPVPDIYVHAIEKDLVGTYQQCGCSFCVEELPGDLEVESSEE
jgi:hypothetical protein